MGFTDRHHGHAIALTFKNFETSKIQGTYSIICIQYGCKGSNKDNLFGSNDSDIYSLDYMLILRNNSIKLLSNF